MMAFIEVIDIIRWRPRLEQETGRPHRSGSKYVFNDATGKIVSLSVFQENMGDQEIEIVYGHRQIENLRIRGDGERKADVERLGVVVGRLATRRGTTIVPAIGRRLVRLVSHKVKRSPGDSIKPVLRHGSVPKSASQLEPNHG